MILNVIHAVTLETSGSKSVILDKVVPSLGFWDLDKS